MKPAKYSTMDKTNSTLPSGSDTFKKPLLSTTKDYKTTNNPTAMPLAIPVALSSDISPTKSDKVIDLFHVNLS
eukprot:6797607-Ditylum_brightwellii.AAC.1